MKKNHHRLLAPGLCCANLLACAPLPAAAPSAPAAPKNPLVTTKEPGKGTGFGLFLVRRFAEQIGGRFDIQSTSGRGHEGAAGNPTGSRPMKMERVLLVDDDATFRERLAGALQRQN